MATPTRPAIRTYFFGWTNIKWIIRELVAMYSSKPSYFSKKRVESSIAFMSAIIVILSYIYTHWTTIQNSDILADASLLFVIAGYAVHQIQSEKKVVQDTVVPATPGDHETPQ